MSGTRCTFNNTYLLDQLRDTVASLGRDGGIISPSIYDTAQALRFYPPQEGVGPALTWLVDQQRADGGWGNPAFPVTRVAPTLATILTIATYVDNWSDSDVVMSGVRFINGQASLWRGQPPVDIPVAAELIIPILLDDAAAMGLPITPGLFDSLCHLGEQRRQLIASMEPRSGSTASFSWEAWGEEPDVAFLDSMGSVGHSPSATAAWLQKASGIQSLREHCTHAEEYLRQASQATHSGIPGVYPTAWPIDRFEQVFGLYALVAAEQLTNVHLLPAVLPQVRSLQAAMTPAGIGFSDCFEPDGDNTAGAVAALGVFGIQDTTAMLDPYRRDTHFSSYPYELQPSLSATARAIHAYRVNGIPTEQWSRMIMDSQQEDGRWARDKWNVSWIYTSVHMILACDQADCGPSLENVKHLLMAHQNPDGSWGMGGGSSMFETALAILGLHKIMRHRPDANIQSALNAAHQWILEADTAERDHGLERLWLNKELYRVPRIERAFELSARLLLLQNHSLALDDLYAAPVSRQYEFIPQPLLVR